MAHETYSIPKSPTAFYHFQCNAIELCTTNATAWSIPTDTLTDITTLQTTYVTANRATQSPAATAAREAAAEPLFDALEDLYNKYLLNNSAIDADDKVGDPAPASPADCPERFNATRSHEPIVFEPAQRGQECYGYARWINRNGKSGPWSSLFSQQIP